MNLEKIAELAGVSRATVSRVINNHPYVKEDVRQRVLEVIEREGFQPNAAARMLARQRTEVLGVISPEGLSPVFSTSYFQILFEGISASINQTDYVMSMWTSSTPAETERIFKRILSYKLMDGALLLSAVENDTLTRRLVERKVPTVMIGRCALPEVLTVDVDNVAAARTATEHLIRLGRRRIGHIFGRRDLLSAGERFQGYQLALEASGIAYDPELVIEGDYTDISGYLAARKLIPRGIDALFSASDTMAVGALQALNEQGLSVPRDVAIIGFDDLPIASTSRPALSTMRQPIQELGSFAVRTLVDLIAGKITPPYRVILPTELILRETCGALGDS